jgi:hypothetical protein
MERLRIYLIKLKGKLEREKPYNPDYYSAMITLLIWSMASVAVATVFYFVIVARLV